MQQFVLHAHFYQPERLNPWTGALDPEPSAAPDRDWNERILAECYRPNGTARIFDHQQRVERIVNNYERLSFNFGPTLLSWMEGKHARTYARVIDGDWRSVTKAGHGNALAQAYNHMILPLANARDVATQIAWGQADFQNRFGRRAEGMWLPETAANPAVVDALIDAEVLFTVLAPYQAARVRPAGGEWRETHGAIDTGRPYRQVHSDGSGRSLAVFFYDGGLAQALAFDAATSNAQVLLERIQAAVPAANGGLVHAALDGETFGHHHPFAELGLAYALFEAAEANDLQPTSYAAYLAEHPPTDEVEVVGGEGTAWSCSHGVGRWYRDCGCSTDSRPGWDQAWRTPLRAALDLVRDAAIERFETYGAELLKDPWAARNAYIDVRLGKVSAQDFMDRHALRTVDDSQKSDLWALLEAQRNAMVMYTSCGWFFADVTGIETVYVLRFAARTLDLLADVGAAGPESEVLDALAMARSNKPGVGTGADVWSEQIAAARVTPRRLAAHRTLVSLAAPRRRSDEAEDVAGHQITVLAERSESRGRLRLSTTRLSVADGGTGRRSTFAVAAVHLGGLDFYGVVAPDPGAPAFAAGTTVLWDAFPTAPLARLLRLVYEQLPGGEEFGLEQLLPEGREAVAAIASSDLVTRFREQYRRLYLDHQRSMEMLTAAGYALPRDLRAAAELTLTAELEDQLAAASAQPGAFDVEAFEPVRRTLVQARTEGFTIDVGPLEIVLTRAVTAAARTAAETLKPADIEDVDAWLQLSGELGIDLNLSRAQEVAWEVATRAKARRLSTDAVEAVARLGSLLGLAPVAWGG